MTGEVHHYSVVVICSGLGGTMSALPIAQAFKDRGKGEVLMLERCTWRTTLVATLQNKDLSILRFLRERKEPVQCWSSAENFRGFLDVARDACRARAIFPT